MLQHFEPPSTLLAFPRLTDLTLVHCLLVEGHLQAMVDAAPVLATLVLENLVEKAPPEPLGSPPGSADAEEEPYYTYYRPPDICCLRIRLRCPTVTAMVLETYSDANKLEDSAITGIELDMPSLRSFRYKGVPLKISLTSPAPGLARVDIDATREYYFRRYQPSSRMVPSFSSTSSWRRTPWCSRRCTSTTGASSGWTTFATRSRDGEPIRSGGRTCLTRPAFRCTSYS